MTSRTFTRLHFHSEYSIVDGLARTDHLVEAAVKDIQPALPVTDLANMFCLVRFYRQRAARASSRSSESTAGPPMSRTATSRTASWS